MVLILGVSSRCLSRFGTRWIGQNSYSIPRTFSTFGLVNSSSHPKLLQSNEKIFKTCLPAVGPFYARQYSPETSQLKESFWEKNERLKRPISPHLWIYQPQITWMMSLVHRTSGLLLTMGVTGFALGTLLLSEPFSCYIKAFSAVLVAHHAEFVGYIIKFLIAYPFVLHTFTGVRHLMWDMGKGFDMRTTYQTGYAALILSFVMTLLIAAIRIKKECPPESIVIAVPEIVTPVCEPPPPLPVPEPVPAGPVCNVFTCEPVTPEPCVPCKPPPVVVPPPPPPQRKKGFFARFLEMMGFEKKPKPKKKCKKKKAKKPKQEEVVCPSPCAILDASICKTEKPKVVEPVCEEPPKEPPTNICDRKQEEKLEKVRLEEKAKREAKLAAKKACEKTC